MDIIDYELKRYEKMKNDLETRKNPDAVNKTKENNTSKSSEFLDTIMNEEKPKEVIDICFFLYYLFLIINFCFTDGTT